LRGGKREHVVTPARRRDDAFCLVSVTGLRGSDT
jgi:hypothetical protein